MKLYLFSLIVIFSVPIYGKNLVIVEDEKKYSAELCNINVSFLSSQDKSESSFKLSEHSNLLMTQLISKREVFGAQLATNLYCQKLTGATYTGSDQEWKSYFQNTIATLANKGAKNIQLTLIGEKTKVYKGGEVHREYRLAGDFKEGHQVIYNLAVLDINSNTIYSFSVSGDFSIEKFVLMEFKRVVESSSL